MNIEIRSVQQNGSMSRHQCLDGAHTHETTACFCDCYCGSNLTGQTIAARSLSLIRDELPRYPLGTKNASPYIPVQLKLQVGAKDASLHSPSEAHREGNAEPKAGMDERPTTGKSAGSEDGRKDDGI